MTQLDELENLLATTWDRERLAVYGDHLQSIGDPRGELVAIDLHGHNAPELASRKQALIVAWLGEELASEVLSEGSVDYGFLSVHHLENRNRQERMRRLLVRAGRYVRKLGLDGSATWRDGTRALLLVTAPLPFLCELDVSRCEERRLQERIGLYTWIRSLPFLEQLRSLRLPSLRDRAEVVELERMIGGLSYAADIVVGRTYDCLRPDDLPARVRVPRAVPWPPPPDPWRGWTESWPGVDRAPRCDLDALELVVTEPIRVDFHAAVETMERVFDDLTASVRAAWTEFWNALGRAVLLEDHTFLRFDSDTLARAVDACEPEGWADLRAALALRPGNIPVLIRRLREPDEEPW